MNSLARFILLYVLILSPFAQAQRAPLESIRDCKLVPTDWGDGDSFQIKTPDGTEHTIRLYGADCLELHVNDDTDGRRLRAQRSYFGITTAKPTRTESIEMAIGLGRSAAEYTAKRLASPFTIHTRKQKALGDSKHQRIFAFVETSDGKDLATELVSQGLARAYGVCNDGPNELSTQRYREILADFELQAAKLGKGAWAFTNWEKLPAERDIQRVEEEDNEIAQGNAALPADFRLNPNTASRDDLDRLPGIGEAIANRIIEVRDDAPFEEAKDMQRVHGIKQKTLAKFEQYLDFDIP
jgi:competence protein ComEA